MLSGMDHPSTQEGTMTDTRIIREIGPEDVAAKPFQLRCLDATCWLARDLIVGDYTDALQSAGEQHVAGTKHRVVIERVIERVES